jgi:sigma-B regulation protein RsbU (phosphoserine phosphatase)
MAAAGAAAGAAFLGAFALALLLCLGPVKAMRKLAADTEALARGEFGTRVTVSGPDVVQAAAKNVQKLAATAAAGAAAQAVPQVIQQQVIVQPVQEVQEGLAPLRGFRRPDEFEIEATQKVCPDLGNDYHDTVNVDEERVGIFVADIPNLRGVRGALYMAQVRALFRAAAPGEPSPAEVLKKVNRAFAQDLPRGVYVTAMYCVVERSTGICKVASAQHLPLVFWKMAKKASAKLQPEGIALGLDPGPVFDKTIVEKAVQIDRGDRIVLHTDGAIAARNAAGAQYGEERFYYVLNREAPKNSAACVNLIANDMDLFHEGAPQMDDFTIVTLRRVK